MTLPQTKRMLRAPPSLFLCVQVASQQQSHLSQAL